MGDRMTGTNLTLTRHMLQRGLGYVPQASPAGRIHLIDRRGHGVSIVLNENRRLSGRRPEYTLIDDSELRLVF